MKPNPGEGWLKAAFDERCSAPIGNVKNKNNRSLSREMVEESETM